MKRSKLAAVVTVVLTVGLSVGGLAPAATAKPHKDRPAAAAKADRGHGKAHKTRAAKASKAERRLAAAQRTALRRIDRKDAALDRQADRIVAAELAGGEVVLANIAGDHTVLDGLATAVEAATTRADVRALDRQVRVVRPATYSTVRTGLQQAAHFEEVVAENVLAIAELRQAADAKALEAYDVTAALAALTLAEATNAQVTALIETAVQQGQALSASSTHADKEAFRATLAGAGDLLDTVQEQLHLAEDALAALTVTEPVATDPSLTELLG